MLLLVSRNLVRVSLNDVLSNVVDLSKCRRYCFLFQLLKQDDSDESPVDGAYIHGLYVDGARWDRDRYSVKSH